MVKCNISDLTEKPTKRPERVLNKFNSRQLILKKKKVDIDSD